MPTSQRSTFVLTVCVCFLAALALCGLTAAAAAADPSLEAVGEEGGRSVPLQVCPKIATGAEPAHTCTKTSGRPYRGGKLTVLIRNTTGEEKTLKVEYLPNGATEPQTLPGDCDRVFLVGCNANSPGEGPESPLTVGGHKSLSISLGFVLPLSESASAIDGTLVVSTDDEKPLAIPVSGEERSFKGVTISPSTLPVDSSDGSATLTLEGSELAEYLRSHGSEEPSAILHGDNGETAEATLTLPTAGEVEASPTAAGTTGKTGGANRATATVTVSGDPAAGKYTGKLALPELPADTGTTSIELHQHQSCVWAVLTFLLMLAVVFAGILVTGVSTRIVTMASRRKLLTDVLTQTYTVFVDVVKKKEGNDKEIEVASWHLDDLLGEDPASADESSAEGGRLQGLPALERSIKKARSSADLDEDAARVLDMVARMQRWLRVEPLARRLAVVAETRSTDTVLPEEAAEGADDKDKRPLKWADSNTVRDTGTLLEMVRREPADPEKADELVARLMFQIDWHNSMEVAWKTTSLSRKRVRELDEGLGEDSNAEERKLGEQDALLARLRGLLKGVKVPDPDPIPGEPKEELQNGMTPVKWDAASNLFTGWATLDGQSYGQLARRTASSSRAGYMPGLDDVWREIWSGKDGAERKADLAWTLVILAFASATYAATTYNETWGSLNDFATAFLAGSLGKATIDWAALPIFQSVRLRKAKES